MLPISVYPVQETMSNMGDAINIVIRFMENK